MSESEFDNALDASDATLEGAKFEKVLGSLQLAAQDAKETGDFLSYSTVLDIYLSDPSRYSVDEREELLSHVLAILSEDSELVYEIGWDLPSLLIPFMDSDYDMSGPLRLVPCVYKVLKLFELLAHDGNPKELFLKCTELLNSIKVTDHATNDPDVAHKYYDIKLYCIFELIDSCLRRIHTLFPLRFLGMTVTSFINSIYLNPLERLSEAEFIWKRVFTFARNYTRPPLPEKIEVDAAELKKINDDEDYLQRKLLTGFLTESISMVVRQTIVGLSVVYFDHLLQSLPNQPTFVKDYELNLPVLDRLYELALSFDMDLAADFNGFLASTTELLDLRAPAGKLDDDITGELFEKLVVDFRKTFAHSLVDVEANEVTTSLGGSLNLYIYSLVSRDQFEKISVTIPQAISVGLRLVIPGIVHSSLCNRGLHDISTLFSWIAMSTSDKTAIELELAQIPSALLRSYYQAILFVIISSNNNLFFRYTALTLLTKYLTLSPENVAYDFLMNCLKECPYENVKAALVGVLKELVTKDKINEDALAESLSKVSVSKDETVAPPLPARDAAKKSKYITLTEERVAELFDVIEDYVELTFVDDESGPTLNQGTVSMLLASLNLLILLKRELLVPQDEVERLTDQVLEKSEALEKKWGGDTSQAALLNTLGILHITIDRLKE